MERSFPASGFRSRVVRLIDVVGDARMLCVTKHRSTPSSPASHQDGALHLGHSTSSSRRDVLLAELCDLIPRSLHLDESPASCVVSR